MDLESVLTQQLSRFSQEPQLLRQIQTLLRLLRGELPTESVQAAADEPSEDDLVNFQPIIKFYFGIWPFVGCLGFNQ